MLVRHVESGKIPGLVALVSRGDETHVEAIGTMRHDGGAPMRRDTIFRMASTSKPVSVAAAMILLDECRLRLDDLVEQWLPELADRRVLKRIDGPLDDTVPAQRLAFVLHDLFAVPFDEIGQILGKSTDATKMLASRARRKVQATGRPTVARREQREVVQAFLAAARRGDFEGCCACSTPR